MSAAPDSKNRVWRSGPTDQEQGLAGMSDAATQSIDLNHATERQLLGIEGVEPALVHALIEYRTHHGHFLSWDDVSRVPGLDAASLEQVQHACRIGGIES